MREIDHIERTPPARIEIQEGAVIISPACSVPLIDVAKWVECAELREELSSIAAAGVRGAGYKDTLNHIKYTLPLKQGCKYAAPSGALMSLSGVIDSYPPLDLLELIDDAALLARCEDIRNWFDTGRVVSEKVSDIARAAAVKIRLMGLDQERELYRSVAFEWFVQGQIKAAIIRKYKHDHNL